MGIIDCHVHLFPDAAAADPQGWAASRGELLWARIVAPRSNGRRVQGWAGVDRMLRDMDAAGIQRCILQGWYWEKADTCVEHNRLMATAIRAHPDRFSAVATFHPSAGEKVGDELRWARDAGFVGLGELCPEAQGFAHNDPVFTSALLMAEEWDWPVTLHVTDPASRVFPGRVETPLDRLVGLAGAHPGVKFVFAHMGGLLPFSEMNPSVARALQNVAYDTAAVPLIYDDRIVSAVSRVIGSGRILFGSDYPILPRGSIEPGFELFLAHLSRPALGDEGERAVLTENARRIYRLP